MSISVLIDCVNTSVDSYSKIWDSFQPIDKDGLGKTIDTI